jgi:hypothetical protein
MRRFAKVLRFDAHWGAKIRWLPTVKMFTSHVVPHLILSRCAAGSLMRSARRTKTRWRSDFEEKHFGRDGFSRSARCAPKHGRSSYR